MMEMREVMTMPPMVVPGQRQARQMARQEIVRQMELGATVSEAQRRCSVPMHRSTIYRLLKRMSNAMLSSANKNGTAKSNARYFAR